MENTEVIKEEVTKLESKLGQLFSGKTTEEITAIKHELSKMFSDIEDAIVQNRALPNGMATKLCENVYEQACELSTRSLASSRRNEYDMTKSNFDQMVSSKDFNEHSRENIEEFKEGGIHEDKSYEMQVDDIMNRVTKVYRQKMEVLNSRGADNAYSDINHIVSRRKDKLMDMHKKFSSDILNEVKQELEKTGGVISYSQMKEVEKKAEEKTNSMLDNLLQDTKSGEEIAKEDAENLSENQKAFKEISKGPTKREDLEAMFK